MIDRDFLDALASGPYISTSGNADTNGSASNSDPDSKSCAAAPLRIPLKVTSPYGPRSLDGRSELHPGVDYAAPIGTPVYAAFPGTVIASYFSGSAGNVIAVQSIAGTNIYEHMSRRLVGSGQLVAAGAEIGLSGNTGHSTGPHLHFEQHTPGPLYRKGVFNKNTAVPPCHPK